MSARQNPRTLGFGISDNHLHCFNAAMICQRPHLYRWVEAISDRDRRSALGKSLRECVVQWRLNKETRWRSATMAHRLKTPEGRKLYALRKQTPEPVFGIIKSVLGFRQFLLRGLDKVRGVWSLVTMAWNIKRMFTLSAA